MKRYFILLLPILFMIGYLVTREYIFNFATTFSCIPIVVYYGMKEKRYASTVIISLAFIFSIAGDWVLKIYFVYGIALFFIAHIWYIIYSLRNGKINKRLLLIISALALVYYIVFLMPAISDKVMNGAVLIYILISCLSVAAAKDLNAGYVTKELYFNGICCLIFSDILISMNKFLYIDIFYFLMLPTYYASQILVTAAIMSRCHDKSNQTISNTIN